MEKKNSINEQEIKKSTFQQRKRVNSAKSIENDKKLPWWVEFLFVQIGLPDKWLIHLLRTKKKANELYKNEKKFLLSLFLFLLTIGYFQPVIRYSSNKLKCQSKAKSYISNNFKTKKNDIETINMIAVNFCNGGKEIDNLVSN
tara:strand:- start:758 stop:1186 length:429 start_codon:yes stop_codon:yes gene_type:complete